MSTGLMKLAPTSITAREDDAIFKQLSSSTSFLPRFQLFVSGSNIVKSGDFTMNHYGLARSADDVTDLGKEVDVVPCAERAKALDLRGDDVLNYFDFNSKEFQEVHAIASDKSIKDSGCMSGIEFLFWVPSVKEFCTFFAQNTSAKREAGKIRSLINDVATMKSKFVKDVANPFQAIVCVKSSSPPEALPSQEEFDKEVTKFKNAKGSSAAATAEESASVTSRVQ